MSDRNTSGDRVTSIQLSDEHVRKAAEELGIRNLGRIPRQIQLAAVSEHAGRLLNLGGASVAGAVIVA
jgi:hypothetical protein